MDATSEGSYTMNLLVAEPKGLECKVGVPVVQAVDGAHGDRAPMTPVRTARDQLLTRLEMFPE